MALMIPLMLVLFISTLDQTIVAAALGPIAHALGGAADAPWIATSYLLTSAVTTLVFGKLGDMLGRKPVFLASVALFTAGSALCASATSMAALVGFRAFQGIGGGGLSSLVMAIVGDLVPARERARFQAVLGLVPAIAVVLGPTLGGLIAEHAGWPWIFLINVPVGVLAFALVAARLHLPAGTRSRGIDWAGGALAMGFSTTFLLLTSWGGVRWPWLSLPVAALALAGTAMLAAYVWAEARAAEPLTPLPLLADPIFSVSSALFFLATAALFVGMLYVPLMLQTSFALSPTRAGLAVVPLLLGLIGATAVSGEMIVKTGTYRRFPIAGSLLGIVGFGALAAVSPTTPIWLILGELTAIGVGIGFFIQVTVLAGQNAVEPRHLGTATGALNFFKTLGGATGAAVFGAVLTAGGFQAVYAGCLPMMAVALVLSLLLREKPLSETMREVAQGHLEVPEY